MQNLPATDPNAFKCDEKTHPDKENVNWWMIVYVLTAVCLVLALGNIMQCLYWRRLHHHTVARYERINTTDQ